MTVNANNDSTLSTTTHSRHKTGSASVSTDNVEKKTNSAHQVNADGGVSLSPEAQRIERLESKIQSSDGINTAKVAELKQKIDDGTYHIDSQSIAASILDQEKLLS
jgi:negative regulator of flagellin synthesis FlgM